ncbi:MAG TPA: DUF4870 domain-containing protein [Anaerolineaceae bacterium]|nr:DUF4870 domain-containing protein [Anaerolineaceae bacterium]HQH84123.1 DUF4870 domain-containing protein [Anaerolineaceae bacterium]
MPSISPPTSRDRALSALAHAGVLIPGFGLLAPLLVWRSERDQQRETAFQALQALGWQVLQVFFVQVTALILGLIYIFIVMVSGPIGLAADKVGGLTTTGAVVLVLAVMGLAVVYALIGLLGAVLCLTGRSFRYPWLGPKLAGYLLVSPDITTLHPVHADRWLAALGHWGIFIPIMGLFTPLMAWLTQPDASPWLKNQSIQTVIYQTIGLVLGGLLQVLVSFLMIPLTMIIPLALAQSDASGDFPVFIAIIGLLVLIVFAILALLVPLYSLLGFIGGIRVLQGKDFNYPLLGRWFKAPVEARSTDDPL